MKPRLEQAIAFCLLYAIPVSYAQRGRPVPRPIPQAEVRPEVRPEARPEPRPEFGPESRVGKSRQHWRGQEAQQVGIHEFLDPRNNESWPASAFDHPNAGLVRYLARQERSFPEFVLLNPDIELQVAGAELADSVFKLGRYESVMSASPSLAVRTRALRWRWAIDHSRHLPQQEGW